MGGVCNYCDSCHCDCIGNNKFPGNKSSDCKPGEKLEDGIIPTATGAASMHKLKKIKDIHLYIGKIKFMIHNYFKIAFRNLIKNKISSFINIGGLAIGMAVAILIGLWIYDELSFNKNFKNYDRIARSCKSIR